MLRLAELTRRFGDVVAVDGVSLEVAPGEFLTLLGPSGCGKTTTLRMIAGFETPTGGRIVLEGRDVTALPPQGRGVGMVFQNYALFPHMDVAENVAFGLLARGVARAEVAGRVERALERVELGGYGRRRVQELSGGQQQRVALARAMAPEPRLLLLDEPLSNLDAALRERTRSELRGLLKELGITAVFVTHDQEEAFALSDRIAVLDRGRLQQVGTPEALYARPTNPFVAGFLGRASFLPARVESRREQTAVCQFPGGERWDARVPEGAELRAGDAVRVMARPESLRMRRTAPGEERGGRELEGEVTERRFAGAATFYRLRADGAEVIVQGGGEAEAGETVYFRPHDDALPIAFPAEAG
ncbi:MAG TPA: ABC transporter ATP-binding protein [Longimicrobiaceae bacterium]|nr:ABC transporter ATP-binding protein [Longimicrobiaceae bacterium]